MPRTMTKPEPLFAMLVCTKPIVCAEVASEVAMAFAMVGRLPVAPLM